jgi:FtsP/CotA-like multicopper oxidase with cupredoxin domain
MYEVSRRNLLLGGLAAAGTATLAACSGSTDPASSRAFGTPAPLTPTSGQKVMTATLRPAPVTIDLGGPVVKTWAYGDTVPGKLIRANAGDLLRVRVENGLPSPTTVHWHGIRLANAADGVPGLTQDPIPSSGSFLYEFTAPDPGTYFFHPHVGVQLDRGLYAPLVIEDPAEPGKYDDEWVIVLDDWIDGTGTTPEEVLKKLIADGGSGSGDMGDMDHMGGGMGMGSAPWGDAGDVTYPYFLINGKAPKDPTTFTAKPGQKIRMRVINAASDTIFTLALGGHRMTITHTDGHAVQPTEVGAFYLGMGERYDVTVTLEDGVFPLAAAPFGKDGQAALAVVRTGSGAAPMAGAMPSEMSGQVFIGSRLLPDEDSRLPERAPDATVSLALNGSMAPYVWGMNGAPFGKNTPLLAKTGTRLRINVTNMTMMTHPLHLHGPAFALADTGLRKDTVLLAPMESRALDLDPDVGEWMVHCHNIYHAEAGMMILLSATT